MFKMTYRFIKNNFIFKSGAYLICLWPEVLNTRSEDDDGEILKCGIHS